MFFKMLSALLLEWPSCFVLNQRSLMIDCVLICCMHED